MDEKYRNHKLIRRRRVMRTIFGAITVAYVVAAIAQRSVDLLSYPAFLILVYLGFFEILPRVGTPVAQDFLEFSDEGVNYGGRQFIPWPNVSCVIWRRRLISSPEPLLQYENWTARGFPRFVRNVYLPVRPFLTDDDFVEIIERRAPHVRVLRPAERR